jgi:hypothetical protein
VRDGVLRHSDLPQIWKFDQSLYPKVSSPLPYPHSIIYIYIFCSLDLRDVRPQLLHLFERFEIVYQLPKHQDDPEPRTLVPCLLPDERPEFDLTWNRRDFTQRADPPRNLPGYLGSLFFS